MKFISTPLVFVDIETTGMSPARDRITEVACIRYEDGKETGRFVSLFNPEIPLPLSIQFLTGIQNHMLAEAPTFDQRAEEIDAIFQGAILVAHNARFDYSFLKAEMERAGFSFKRKLLCTARLSRKLYPEHPRHNLSIIIERHGLTCEARHRALGDTLAMRDFVLAAQKEKGIEVLRKAAEEILKNSYSSPNIPSEVIDSLPSSPGTYSFYDQEGALLYVGKSVNIKNRVISHFHSTHREGKDLRLWQETAHIETQETGSDLGASLLELHQIKTLSPAYNRRSRRARGLWYLVKKETKNSYIEFELKKTALKKEFENESIYALFKEKRAAIKTLEKIIEENKLCRKTFGLEKSSGACFGFQLGNCRGSCIDAVKIPVYNQQIELIFHQKKVRAWPHSGSILLVTSHTPEKKEFFLIKDWILQTAYTQDGDSLMPLFSEEEFTFDYEVYKLLIKAILKPGPKHKIYPGKSKEFKNFTSQV